MVEIPFFRSLVSIMFIAHNTIFKYVNMVEIPFSNKHGVLELSNSTYLRFCSRLFVGPEGTGSCPFGTNKQTQNAPTFQ